MIMEFEIDPSNIYKNDTSIQKVEKVELPVLSVWKEGFNKYEKPYVTNFAALAWLKRGWSKTVI